MLFAVFPPVMVLFRWFIFLTNEIRLWVLFKESVFNKRETVTAILTKYIKSVVKDPELAAKLTPNYEPGCKRITPSDTYLKV